MPELPEVEITARRLDAALRGATIESALAPGINALKTFDPPLSALEGRAITSITRRGKQFVIEVAGDLALLVHLMSAGRLQLYDKRAGPRDRTSRLLLRIEGDRELRLREFGTKQAAWVKLLPADAIDDEELIATLGPEAWPQPPEDLRELLQAPRPLHTMLRDQRVIAGIGRSWVDEILWTARLSPFKRGDDLSDDEALALREAIATVLDGAIEHYEQRHRAADPRQAAAAAAGPPQGRRAVPALRHDDRAGPLRGLRHVLLPGRADAGQGAQGPAPVAAAEVVRRRRCPAQSRTPCSGFGIWMYVASSCRRVRICALHGHVGAVSSRCSSVAALSPRSRSRCSSALRSASSSISSIAPATPSALMTRERVVEERALADAGAADRDVVVRGLADDRAARVAQHRSAPASRPRARAACLCWSVWIDRPRSAYRRSSGTIATSA